VGRKGSSPASGREFAEVHAEEAVDEFRVGALSHGRQLAQVHADKSVDELGVGALRHKEVFVAFVSLGCPVDEGIR